MHTRACASKQIGKADDTSLLVPESTYVRVMNGHCRDDVSRSQDTNFIISPTKVDGFDCYFGILSVGFYTTTSFFAIFAHKSKDLSLDKANPQFYYYKHNHGYHHLRYYAL
jgi:hypothetical protein